MKRRRRRRSGGRVRQRLQRGAYILPSLFTIGNIVLGFYAVVLGTRGHFKLAASAVFVAAIMDAFDGRIARFMHTESDFGKEFDSLADVLTFGATPALLTFLWGFQDYGRLGWLVPLYFLLCTSIRLARFNVQTGSVDSSLFIGMPSPAAACSVGACLFFSPQPDTWSAWVTPQAVEISMFAVVFLMGSLMVSTFRYPSGKKIDLKRPWSPRSLMTPLTASILVLIWILDHYPNAFFVSFGVLYTLTGPLHWLRGFPHRRGEAKPAAADSEVAPDDIDRLAEEAL
jgi:CDP-diacylglycerol--serine O-phosphatidyltransferase